MKLSDLLDHFVMFSWWSSLNQITIYTLIKCVQYTTSYRDKMSTRAMQWFWYSSLSTKKPVTTMLTYPWKCTVLHCNHLGNTWKPLVLMTQHFDYYLRASEGDNQSVRSSAPVHSIGKLRGWLQNVSCISWSRTIYFDRISFCNFSWPNFIVFIIFNSKW